MLDSPPKQAYMSTLDPALSTAFRCAPLQKPCNRVAIGGAHTVTQGIEAVEDALVCHTQPTSRARPEPAVQDEQRSRIDWSQ